VVHLISVVLCVSLMGCHADPASAASPEGGGRTSHRIQVGGELRRYNLYVPSLSSEAHVRPLPLMIVLHGGLGNAERIEATTGMNAIADREHFAVAYPQGTAAFGRGLSGMRTWNAGSCCGAAQRRNADDVGFVAALIDDVAAAHPIDRRRVYAVGMSNGGMLAYRLACELPERLAAVVAVSATLTVDGCAGAAQVAVLHVHGDQDQNIPFAGGRGDQSLAGVEFRAVPDAISALLRPRGECRGETAKLPGGIERTVYSCSAGAPVELVVLRGAGHAWPGADDEERSPSRFPASEEAWSFASRFARED
jgi:polyhydroxybutyrate depolymerase